MLHKGVTVHATQTFSADRQADRHVRTAAGEGFLGLQDDGNPVRFRDIGFARAQTRSSEAPAEGAR